MKRMMSLGIAAIAAVCLFSGAAMAQVVPDTVDPYELAPQNVHLYPVSLNARMPYYYLPPIFAPAPMWRGALTAQELYNGGVSPHNYVAYEIPDSTALVAWGTVDGDERVTLEAANQQEFMFVPPGNLNDGSSWYRVKTGMRFVPNCTEEELQQMMDRELMLGVSRVNSIADKLPVDVLLYEYDQVRDIADLQPRINEVLRGNFRNADGLATMEWPVDNIYINYSGYRRNPNRIRSLGDLVPHWFTCEGKILARRDTKDGCYLMTVEFYGYNPWYPIETAKNMMRKMLALSFDEFVETAPYYDFEKALNGKEWHRQGSGLITPYDTRRRAGTGSAGQGAY